MASSMLAFALAALGFVSIVGIVIGAVFTPLLGAMAAVFLAVLFIITGRSLATARRRRAAMMLALVEQGVRLNLPLPPMLRSAARGESGIVQQQLNALAAGIEDGKPIAEALAAASPCTPRRVVELCAAAERNGTLGTVLPRLIRDERALARRDPASGALARAYAAIVVCGLATVIGALATLVMPKFEQIFKDFGMPMPPLTRTVMSVAGALAPPLAGVAGVAMVWMIGRGMRDALLPRPLVLPLNNLFDRIVWLTPIAHALAGDRGMGDTCHVIADALEVGRPLDAAVLEAEHLHLNAVLRGRLGRWASGLAAGVAPAVAARDAAMPAAVVGFLAAALPGGSAADTFRFLGRYYDSRFSRAATAVRSVVVPAMALVAGVVTAATALAVILPLVQLIDHTGPYPEVRL